MLTAGDIKKLIAVFATKADLEQIRSEMVTRVEFEERMDYIVSMFDKVFGELKFIREDQIIHGEAHRKIKEELHRINAKIGL
ncbi:MAG: hypothetical protein Q7S45_01190 [Candidatus Curtissbacteria bacterium]|nr:hypothetical protein [Candidatus Curtissbacteria bacterium]